MINQTEIPKEVALEKADINSKKFITNWLSNRKLILKKNIETYNKLYDKTYNPADYSNERVVNGELLNQLSRLDKINVDSNYSLTKDGSGEFNKETKKITINQGVVEGRFGSLDNIITHERVHSLRPLPQETSIKQLLEKHKVISNNFYNTESSTTLNNSGEIYARLMSFRKQNGLLPDKVVNTNDLKQWKSKLRDNELGHYPKNFLLDLFNTIAQNKPKNGLINNKLNSTHNNIT